MPCGVGVGGFNHYKTMISTLMKRQPGRDNRSNNPVPAETPQQKYQQIRSDWQQKLDSAKASKAAAFQARVSHVEGHEAAHMGEFATGGPVINADPETGHVSGYVPIRMDFGRTAGDAERNAAGIIAQALGPSDPSGPDQAIAASAATTGPALAAQRRAMLEKMLDKASQKNPDLKRFGQGLDDLDPAQNPFRNMAPPVPNPQMPALNSDMVSPQVKKYQATTAMANSLDDEGLKACCRPYQNKPKAAA